MIWVMNGEGDVIYVGVEWTHVTGQPVERALGRGWRDSLPADDLARVLPVIDAACQSRSAFTITHRLRTRLDEFVWVVAGAIPSVGPPGASFLGYLGSLTRIDARTKPRGADGWVGRFHPPGHPKDMALGDTLDLVADYLLMAHTLVLDGGAWDAVLAPLRTTMFNVAVELARRNEPPSEARH